MSARNEFPWEYDSGPGYRKEQWQRMCDRIDQLQDKVDDLEIVVRANDPGEPTYER